MPESTPSSSPPTCALLVSSCDAYSDLWIPYFTLLNRYWKNCPYKVYLGTGHDTFAHPEITMLHSDGGRVWSKRMLDYLDVIPDDFVIVVLEDFFLRKPVRQDQIDHCLKFARDHRATQVRLMPRPGPTDQLRGEKLIGSSCVGSPFRLSTQGAIWDRRKLRALLRPEESIWEFESRGNTRANELASGFYSTWKPVLPYRGWLAHHVVEKGKWLLHEKWIWQRRRVGADFSKRQTMNLAENIDYQAVVVLYHGLKFLPWSLKRGLLKILRMSLRPFMPPAIKKAATPSGT